MSDVSEDVDEREWGRIEERLEALQRRRGLAPSRCAEIDALLRLDFVHASIALDGNGLAREEVEHVLATGEAIGGKSVSDHLEALDQHQAFDVMLRLAHGDQPLREADLRHLHAALLGRSRPESAGRYREGARTVEGSLTTFPEPSEIEGLVSELVAWLSAQPAEARVAIEAHERLVSIQPFEDGNGRAARLLMNLLLLRGGYPLLVVGPEQRAAYHASLEAVQLGGPSGPYERLMLGRLVASFDRYLEGAS